MVILAGLVFYLVIAFVRYYGMHAKTYDLIIFDQAVSSYAHFLAPASYVRDSTNLLGDHFHPILILLAPFYWLFASPLTLIVAQVILILASVPAVYLFARQVGFKHTQSVILAVGILFSAGNLLMVQFDFHELSFAVPFLAWAVYAMYSTRWRLLIFMIIGLALTKENMLLVIGALGVVLIARRHYRLGIAVLLAGVSGFMVITKVVMPYFAHGIPYSYWRYTSLGPDLPSSVKAVISDPLHAITIALYPAKKILLLLKTFLPVLGLNFLSPLFIVCLPLLGERIMSDNPNYWEYGYHYQALLGLSVYLAAMDGAQNIGRCIKGLQWKRRLSWVFPVVLAVFSFGMMLYVVRFTYVEGGYTLAFGQISTLQQAVEVIPENAKICTTNHVGPYIQRYYIHPVEWNIANVTCDYVIYHATLDGGAATIKSYMGERFNQLQVAYSRNNWVVMSR